MAAFDSFGRFERSRLPAGVRDAAVLSPLVRRCLSDLLPVLPGCYWNDTVCRLDRRSDEACEQKRLFCRSRGDVDSGSPGALHALRCHLRSQMVLVYPFSGHKRAAALFRRVYGVASCGQADVIRFDAAEECS